MTKKLKALFSSRRFYAAVIAAIILAAGESFGLDESTRKYIAGLAVAWIAGDSYRPTT